MTREVIVLVKIVDPDLTNDDTENEVQYLIEDLRDLTGMSQTRFYVVNEIRNSTEIRVGIRFEINSTENLGSALKRLRDRLFYNPIETRFLLQIADFKLQVQTHTAEDLTGLLSSIQSGFLFSPQYNYLLEAEKYVCTHGYLSRIEIDNLNLLRQRLGLTQEQARDLNDEVAGKHKTQDEKHRHFEKIAVEEFMYLKKKVESYSFASKDHRPILQELAENLGLPQSDVEPICQRYDKDYHDYIELKSERKLAKIAKEAEVKAEAQRQKQIQQVQKERDYYRALCGEAMANGLYPSEYNQGRLDQACRLRGIAIDEATKIETELRDELYGSIASAAGVNYNRLRLLLHQQAWAAADLETETVILKALNLDMQPVTAATVQRLPGVDLATIDALWQRYSNGRFGFKAQQQVYRSQQQIQQDDPQRWSGFQQALGWRYQPSWLSRGFRPYYDLDFSLDAPSGHLPTWRWCCPSLGHRYSPSFEVVEAVLAHLNACMPLEAVAIPTFDQTLVVGGVASAS